jgi:hypothetical protein
MAATIHTEVATDASPQASARQGSGLIVRSAVNRGVTELDVACDEGIRTVRIAALPDARAARAVSASMRRLASVRFDIDGSGARCAVRGVGHRTPRELPVSLSVGLGLVRLGLVALVVWQEAP